MEIYNAWYFRRIYDQNDNDLTFDQHIAEIYYGAIKVLEQNYDERFHQSAHSIRYVLAVMSREEHHQNMSNRIQFDGEKDHERKLVKTLDPLGGAPLNNRQDYNEILRIQNDYFMSIDHYKSSFDKIEYYSKLKEFETLLNRIVLPHDEVIKNIDKLLKKNATKNNFGELRSSIERNLSSYNYFFNKVNSSKWFQFLQNAEYFDNLEHIDERGEHMDWPPGKYLLKMSKIIPDQVSKILLNMELPKKNNERSFIIMRYLMNILLNLPPKHSKKFVTKIIKEHWMENQHNHVNINVELEMLVKKLAESNYENESLELCARLISFNYVNRDNISITASDVQPIIGSYHYENMLEKTIPELYRSFHKPVVFLLIDNLNSILSMMDKKSSKTELFSDNSIIWCKSITPNKENFDRGFKTKLLGLIGKLLIDEGNRSKKDLREELLLLDMKKYSSFTRLKLHIYRKFPNDFRVEINKSAIKFFNNDAVIYEYHHMVNDCCSLLSDKTLDQYLKFVEMGPDGKINVEGKIKNWKAKKIKPIFQRLSKTKKIEYGWITHEKLYFLDAVIHHSGVVQSKPMSNLRDGLTPERVLEFIRTQSMPKEVFGYYDSTPKKFQEYVEACPDDFSDRAIELFDMGKYTYIVQLFRGIANVSKNERINWHMLLSLSEKLIILEKKDHTYSDIMMSMMRMFGQAMDHNSIGFDNREKIWHVLKSSCVLLQNFERFGVDDDAYTAAINSVFGTIFESIILYTSWYNKHTPKKSCLPPEVKQLFDNYMDKKINNSIYGHAILGSQIPFLYQLDKTFSNKMISILFNNSDHELSSAAWESYTMNNISVDLFKIFHLELTDDDQLKHSDELLIQHVLLAYLYKFPNSQKIFENIVNIKNDNISKYCSWFVSIKLK